ncbi:MAG: ABC transporter ATP-binding protein [Candidatus Riflebacteria bacterium]
MQKIVLIERLNYSYHPGHKILEDIDFSIENGQVFVFLGHNGAGKTTLLRLMLDFIKGYSGKIELFGYIPSEQNSRQKIGFMSEQPVVYDYENAQGYLNYFADLSQIENKESRIAEMMDLTGLQQHAHKKLGQYSKGMLQRLNLARSLLNDPELLIMDEPVIGLDPLGQDLIEKVVHQRRQKGHSVLVNTHSISFAAKVADRVGFLMGGKLKRIFEKDEFTGRAEILEKAFLEYAQTLSMEDRAR